MKVTEGKEYMTYEETKREVMNWAAKKRLEKLEKELPKDLRDLPGDGERETGATTGGPIWRR